MKKIISIAIGLLLLLSCFDGEGDTSVSPEEKEDSEISVDSAASTLGEVIDNMSSSGSGISDPSQLPEATDISAAHGLFSEALDKNPNNKDAHLGIALTNVLMISQTEQMNDLYTKWSQLMSNQEQEALAKKTSLSQKSGFSLSVKGTNIEKDQLIDAYINLPRNAYQEPLKFSEVQQLIEDELIPRLEESIDHLNNVIEDSDYKFMVSPEMQGRPEADSLELDLTEVYALKAGLHSLHSLANITIAYDVDISADPTLSEMKSTLSQDSDFLTLRQGDQPMKDARESILNGTTALKNSKEFLLSEEDDQSDDIISQNDLSSSEIEQIEMGINEVETHLEEKQTHLEDFNGDGENETITVDAKQIFENPVNDIKALIPNYELSIESVETVDYEGNTVMRDAIMLEWEADSYSEWNFPDPTINGFLPDMTDQKLKNMVGITESGFSKKGPLYIPQE